MGKVINEIGNKHGKLLVIDRADNINNRAAWICKCDCGNYITVIGKELRNGHTKSCGCLRKEKAIEILKKYTETGKFIGVDLTGKKFGKLRVIKEVDSVKNSYNKNVRRWLCKCECGNEVIVKHVYLTTGDTLSCGCLNSKGEMYIENLLKNNNINFIKQFSFEDLKNTLPLHFDFAILDKNNDLHHLIEFDGEQHYKISNGYFTKDLVINDMKKNEYCLSNNISLIRIPYKMLNNLNLDILINTNLSENQYVVQKIDHYNLENFIEK